MSYVSFLWYRGFNANNEIEVFRFMRGHSPTTESGYGIRFVKIDGPYKTKKVAEAITGESL